MQLSSEDSLRLNVLLANAEAVRIDENAMVVYGLEGERELKVPLNPTCRADKYLTLVREALSSAVLDSPGGYPVFLRRWTRMGQIDSQQMDRLLKLGEPEAVMAVVCSPGLNDELARRAWWVAPYAEHARRMLENPRVVAGSMGPVLAQYLVEYLPFETEHQAMLHTVRLVLQPGLLNEEGRHRLWEAGRSKKTYRVGFLDTLPDALPDTVEARGESRNALASLLAEGDPMAHTYDRLLSSAGQTFLEVALDAMRRPADQDVASALLNAIGRYVARQRDGVEAVRDIEQLQAQVQTLVDDPDGPYARLLAVLPDRREEVAAMALLAGVSEALLTPIFARTDAVGSLMRRKIEPVTAPIGVCCQILRGVVAR